MRSKEQDFLVTSQSFNVLPAPVARILAHESAAFKLRSTEPR
jgi:hypothetical protein